MNLKEIVNQQIYMAPLSELKFEGKTIINTINPHSYCEAKKDTLFAEALISSDVLLPDGTGIVLAAKLLTGLKINKIAGADIHQYLLEQANSQGQKVFYLGAATKTLQLIKIKIQKEYPNIKIATFSPPFKTEFSIQDTKEMIAMVNAFQPTILFVGMTAPKQEKWVYMNQNKIDANVIVSIGAVFDFYAGTVRRSSPFWIKIGLEWLPRLLRDPKRLWKRNFVSTPCFLWDVFLAKVRS